MAITPEIELGYQVAQAVFLVVAAPLVQSLIQSIKYRLLGQRGPSLWFAYQEFFAQIGKESIGEKQSSALKRMAPFLLLGIALLAAGFVPIFVPASLGDLFGDLIFLWVLFLLTYALQTLATLDTNTSFSTLPSGKHFTLALLVLPVWLISCFAIALAENTLLLGPLSFHTAGAQGTDFFTAYAPIQILNLYTPARLLALFAFFFALLGETGRLTQPSKNPGALFENNEIASSYSGRSLALISYASQLRQMILIALFATLFIPGGIAIDTSPLSLIFSFLVSIFKILGICLVLAWIDSRQIKPKFFSLSTPFAIAFGAAFLAVFSAISDKGTFSNYSWESALVQIGNGLILLGAIAFCVLQQQKKLLRSFVFLSFTSAFVLFILSFEQESWLSLALGLLLAASTLAKALLIPYLLRKNAIQKEPKKTAPVLSPVLALIVSVLGLFLCISLGRTWTNTYGLSFQDTLSAGLALLFVGALGVAMFHKTTKQLLSLALLGEGIVLIGIATTPIVPLGGFLLDLLILALFFGKFLPKIPDTDIPSQPKSIAAEE